MAGILGYALPFTGCHARLFSSWAQRSPLQGKTRIEPHVHRHALRDSLCLLGPQGNEFPRLRWRIDKTLINGDVTKSTVYSSGLSYRVLGTESSGKRRETAIPPEHNKILAFLELNVLCWISTIWSLYGICTNSPPQCHASFIAPAYGRGMLKQ